mmetsp:Transcript_3182/g.4785  ORF Transcript_3182/g.4785 Transcript_3182/m.4785 type:complete len:152 (+) Transcript_3182:52-507(+)
MYVDPQQRPRQPRTLQIALCLYAIVESVLLISVASRHGFVSHSFAQTTPATSVRQFRPTTVQKRASMPIFSGKMHSPSLRKVSVNAEEPVKKKGPGIISREDEPDDYWMSKDERDGKSPLQDPLAWSAILGLLVPFTILGIAIATGYVPIK